MRMSRYLLSPSFSPWLRGLPGLAGSIRDTRVPLAEDNPFLAAERTLIGSTTSLIEASRINRDAALERMFEVLYGRASSRGV